MPSKYAIGALAILLSVGGSGVGGWWVRGKVDDSRQLAVERTQRAAELETLDAVRKGMESATTALQKVKPGLREIRHEITNTVYRDRECFDDKIVSQINKAASGGLDGPVQ